MRSAKRLLGAAFWSLVLPVGLRAQEHGPGEAEGGASLFSVDLGLTLWTIVIFLGLMAILWKFAWGPILGAVNAREEAIRRDLEKAASEREEAERLLQEHKRQLAEARKEAQQILAESREAGDKLGKQMEEKAREEGQRLLEAARREIERERDAALDTLRKEAVELAMAAASKLLEERLDQPRDRELVTDYLDRLSERKGSAQA